MRVGDVALGSRGIGNMIGQLYIELARKDMKKHFINLPDRDLSYLVEGTDHFDDYVEAMTLGAGLRGGEPSRDDGRGVAGDA
jgi:RNA-splicing ligase RtcB